MKKFYLIITCMLLASIGLCGGGWMQGKGNTFLLLSQRYIGGGFYSDLNRQILDLRPTSAGYYTTHLYMERGLSDRWDLMVHAPVLSGYYYRGSSILGVDQNRDAFGPGDVDLAIKRQLLSGKVNVAGSLLLGIPTGSTSGGPQGDVMLGDGEFNQMVKVDASSSFGNGYFATVTAGFNQRSNGYSDEIHAALEMGVSRNKLVAILKMYLLKSTFNGNASESTLPGIYSNNVEYFAVSPVFIYKMKNKGLLLDLGFAPYLRNILAVPSFTLGFYWEFKAKNKS